MSDLILTAYDGAILGPVAKVLGWIMNLIYMLMLKIGIGNISFTIIIFTIVIYMLLLPITYKQQKFSKLTQKMHPELQKVQKKYQGKKDQASLQAMQAETQEVYEKYGVSPMGNCIYMLINMPILLALYRVFYNVPAYLGSVKAQFSDLVKGVSSVPGYQDTMAALVKDLKLTSVRVDFTSVKDPAVLSNYLVDTFYAMNSSGWDMLKEKFTGLTDVIVRTQNNLNGINRFLGMNISDSPIRIIRMGMENKTYLLAILALFIPVASYLTQALNLKLMPQATGGDDAMSSQIKMMNRVMPLISLFFCFNIPVGLGVYWVFSALVRLVQQIFLNKHFEKIDLDDMIRENQEKARKKREKMGITTEKMNTAARINARKIDDSAKMSAKEKDEILEKAEEARKNAKPGSMAEKANLVKKFNEKNTK